MAVPLSGRVAIVIGGGRGIGRAYCEELLENGARLVFGDILEEESRATEYELKKNFGRDRVVYRKCDVCSESDVEGLFTLAGEKFGHVSLVVNNVGILNESAWQRCIEVNVGGAVRVTNITMQHLSREHGGSGGDLVHTASKSGFMAESWGPVYCATKHAVVGLVRSWATPENYNMTGVRVSCICPTTINTPFLENVKPGYTRHAETSKKFLETVDKIPPSDVGKALIKLLRDDIGGGAVLRVSRAHGLDYVEFQEHPIQ